MLAPIDPDRRKHARDRGRGEQCRGQEAGAEHGRLAGVEVGGDDRQREPHLLEGRDAGQSLSTLDQAPDVVLGQGAHLAATQAGQDDAEGVGMEHLQGLARHPQLAQHHHPGL